MRLTADPGPAQHIDDAHRFQFFKTFGQRYQNASHISSLKARAIGGSAAVHCHPSATYPPPALAKDERMRVSLHPTVPSEL